MGALRIFFRGGQIRGPGNESPPAGSRGGALVTKNCENNA